MTAMTKDQLVQLIKSAVDEQLGPLSQQNTRQMAELMEGFKSGNIQVTGVAKEGEKGLNAARAIRAFAASKGIPSEAARLSAKWFGENHQVTKALAVGTGSAGGMIVPPEYSREIIELLRGTTAVRKLNPVIVPMDNGTITMPGLAGGSSASYIGENSNIPRTEPSFNQVAMSWKKLAALVPISNDLLRYSNPAADTIVRDDLVAAMAWREDLAFIRDNGTSNTPKGLRYWAPAGNLLVANATVNAANIRADLNAMLTKLRRNKSRRLRVGWILPVGAEAFLRELLDASNINRAFPEMQNGNLMGYPYEVSDQIPENLGAGTNQTEIYLADFADIMIGEAQDLVVDVSTEAAYHDGTNVVAAFSLDQTVIRAIAEHDLAPRHAGSIVVLTAATWGTTL